MRSLPERLPDVDRRQLERVPQPPCVSVDRNHYSIDPAFAGRRVEVRVTQEHVTAPVLDTGELVCRAAEFEQLRVRRRQRHEVEVELRPLSRYDAVIPA